MRYVVLTFLIALSLGSLWPISKAQSFQFFGQAIPRSQTAQPLVALTFDDGPSRRHTSTILGILEQKNATATFFLTGHEVLNNPNQAQAIVAQGHELGNHSFSHDRLIFKSPARIKQELRDTDTALRDTGYAGPIPFRPPYGQKLFVLPWLLASDERASVMWDVGIDNEDISPDALAQLIVQSAEPGSIILMHVMYNSRQTSRLALPLVIDGLRDKGLSLVTVSELLSRG